MLQELAIDVLRDRRTSLRGVVQQVAVEVQHVVVEADGIGRRPQVRGPAHDGADPGHEHLGGERLGDKLVRPDPQPEDHVLIRVAGGNDHDGNGAGLSQPLEELVPVDPGEIDVQHHQVVLFLLERLEGRLSTLVNRGLHPFLLEIESDELRHLPDIFYYKDFCLHCSRSPRTDQILPERDVTLRRHRLP